MTATLIETKFKPGDRVRCIAWSRRGDGSGTDHHLVGKVGTVDRPLERSTFNSSYHVRLDDMTHLSCLFDMEMELEKRPFRVGDRVVNRFDGGIFRPGETGTIIDPVDRMHDGLVIKRDGDGGIFHRSAGDVELLGESIEIGDTVEYLPLTVKVASIDLDGKLLGKVNETGVSVRVDPRHVKLKEKVKRPFPTGEHAIVKASVTGTVGSYVYHRNARGNWVHGDSGAVRRENELTLVDVIFAGI